MASAIGMSQRWIAWTLAASTLGWSCQKAPPAGGSSPVTSASASAPEPILAAPTIRKRVEIVLDAPAFAAAQALRRAGNLDGFAASALTSPEPAVAYAVGVVLASAGKSEAALAAFDRAASDPAWTEPASYRAANELVKLSRLPEAAERAAKVQSGRPYFGEARLWRADAALAAGNREEAARLYREHVAGKGKPARWADASVRLAKLLAADERTMTEAERLLRRVHIEAPVYARSSGGTELYTTLLKRRGASEKLSASERLERAKAWLDGDSAKARAELTSLAHDNGADRLSRCRAMAELAKLARKKSRADAADAWVNALPRCEGEGAELVNVLYTGAKTLIEAKRDAEGRQWFARIEAEYPSHRLADDARFRRALAEKEAGEMDAFARDMSSVPDAFPKGDMGAEAVFRVALARLEAKDYAAAEPLLARVESLEPPGFHHWASAGRAKYFRARCNEIGGKVDDAKTLYSDVLRAYPLTYYALLAQQRLTALDAPLAEAVLAAQAKQDEAKPALVAPERVVQNDAYQRAKLLFAAGDQELAHRELASSSLTATSAAAEDVWEIAGLYVDGGDARHGHAFTRERLTEHLAHAPRGGYREMWEIAYPRAFAPIVQERASRYGVRTSVIWGVMREESTFAVDAKSGAGAVGLMQLMPDTAKWMAKGTDVAVNDASLRTAETSVELGSKLLARLFTTQVRYPYVLAGYNAGEGASKRFRERFRGQPLDVLVELVPYDETRGYIKRVTQSTFAFAALYEPDAYAWLLRDSLTAADGAAPPPAPAPAPIDTLPKADDTVVVDEKPAE